MMSHSAGLLLSSPARQTLHDRLIMLSSSPVFPSLDELIARNPKKPTLRSGSRAAPIPDNASLSFTSAADFLRSGQADEVEDLPVPAEKEPPKKTRKAPRKSTRAPKTVIDLSADTPQAEVAAPAAPTTKRRRKPLAEKNCKPISKSVLDVDEGSSPLKEKPWKKYKAVQGEEEDKQASSREDSESAPNTRDIVDAKDSGNTSKHSKKSSSTSRAAKASTPEPLNIEPCLPRRMDWTPPKPDVVNLMSDASEAQEIHTPKSTNCSSDTAKDVFKNLRDTYGCKAGESIVITEEADQTKVLGKRKLVEMVAVREPTAEPEPPKPAPTTKTKAPKKKPRTITELATAAYIVKPAEPQGTAEVETLRTFLDAAGGDQATIKKPPEDTKSKKKSRASRVTKKKPEPKRQILLSPQAALRQSAGQDFLFGTSSQLAQEQSPTFLRDLQAAIQASNSAQDDPFSSPAMAIKRKANNRLWSVGARDEDGELLDLEVIDLVNSPAFPEDTVLNPILNPWKDLPREKASSKIDSSGDLEVLDAQSTEQPPRSHFFLSQRASGVATKEKEIPSSSGALHRPSPAQQISLDDEPPPSNQEQIQEDTVSSATKNKDAGPPRPKYELFTDTQLAKQVKSYGFKPVKKRTAMIALLDQCWASKNRALSGHVSPFSSTTSPAKPRAKVSDASPSKSTSTAKPRGRPRKDSAVASTASKATGTQSASAAASPKRPRGRPRKDSSTSTARPQTPVPSTPKRKKASTQPRAEIADSDCDELPSSSLLSPGQEFSPVGVDLTVSGDTEMSLTVDPTDQEAVLFRHITRAVTSAPRTQDPSEPSWHEKMLMYDPIVLEDLAAWLNSGRLTEVGYDGEVAPGDVKKWCESKSICCLWRVNLNGKERKRF